MLSTPFTVFAVIGGINAFNMLDGIDGLVGSVSVGVFCLLLILGIAHNHSEIQFLCTVFIAATGAFLLFNLRLFGRQKANVFLGDAGSTLLGFSISCLLITASQGEQNIIAPVTVLWIIAIPLFDTCSIMLRRIRKGTLPFIPDREHFHHILPVAGYSVNQTVAIIFFSSFFLGSVGIAADLLFDLPEWLLFYLFLGLFGLYLWGINHAWKVMKIARYLHEKNQPDRRSGLDRRKYDEYHDQNQNGNRRTTGERRGGKDRRYHDAICALVKINNRKGK
jgi:UDP-GlcNAc:undecaprenyl-phosphate GlcNAc-1-phosphate transferase